MSTDTMPGAALGAHLTPGDLTAGIPVSVWVTAQDTSRFQRLDRYTPDSIRHPAKMLPAIARHAITAYTQPGDLVYDPMCGIGTTLVEAVHLGRDALGTEYEHEWADLAIANLAHAATQGATGHGALWCTDARRPPPRSLTAAAAGRVRLLLTSPPYGPTNHGRVRTEGYGGHTGKVDKQHHHYSRDRANLAYRPTGQLLDGFAEILTQARTLLAPGAIVAVTARPWRRGGELINLPSAVFDAGRAAGLTPVERCVALLARYDHDPQDGEALVAHGSFFQLKNIRDARALGRPESLLVHEDVLVLASPDAAAGAGQR